MGHQEALRNTMQTVCAETQTEFEAFSKLHALSVSFVIPRVFLSWLSLCTFSSEACGSKRLLHISVTLKLWMIFYIFVIYIFLYICDNFCFLTSPHIINLESVVLPGKQILYFAAIFSIFMGFLFYHSDYYYVVEMQMTNKIKFAYGWLWLALCTCYAWLITVPLGRVPPSKTNC